MSSPNSPADTTVPFRIELRFPAQDLQEEWQRCDLLANYIAEYVSPEFTESEWAENLISTVANECLEAVARLSPADEELSIGCEHRDGEIVLDLRHGLRRDLGGAYDELLAVLGGPDLDRVYFELLAAPERQPHDFNQVGLAMIAHDFAARIERTEEAATGRAAVRIHLPMTEVMTFDHPEDG